MTVLHVVPREDLVEHDDESTDCICGPDVERVIGLGGAHGTIVVHHALDGREEHEVS